MNTAVYFSDTTLRDGEQAPGVAFDLDAKVAIAQQLVRLGVDEIEAGFPGSSPEEVEAIQAVSRVAGDTRVAVLVRALRSDLDAAREALRYASRPVATIFAPASDLHVKVKLNQTRDGMLAMIDESVRYARQFFPNVAFSAEDATRADPDVLDAYWRTAIEAGASMVSIPDTVGYVQPVEFAALVGRVRRQVGEDIDIRVHCHNDLGLAVANSLAAIQAGANVVSGTITGIGERAGNAALEEVIVALIARQDHYRPSVNVRPREIYATCTLVSRLSGIAIARTKPLVGANAFTHSAGIHQQGVLRDRRTYEVTAPGLIGAPQPGLLLGKHTGRHGLRSKLLELGVPDLEDMELDRVLKQLKRQALRDGTVTADALLAIVRQSS